MAKEQKNGNVICYFNDEKSKELFDIIINYVLRHPKYDSSGNEIEYKNEDDEK